MSKDAAASTAIGRMQQRLHRHELRLARLKKSLDNKRQADARLKLRLGGLLYLVGWENLPDADLEKAINAASLEIQSRGDDDSLKTAGENFLRKYEADLLLNADPADSNYEKQLEITHQKISKGGMMVKHELQKYDRATVLGALLLKSGKSPEFD